MYKMQTTAIDDPVVWASVSSSIWLATVLNSYSVARRCHFDTAVSALHVTIYYYYYYYY